MAISFTMSKISLRIILRSIFIFNVVFFLLLFVRRCWYKRFSCLASPASSYISASSLVSFEGVIDGFNWCFIEIEGIGWPSAGLLNSWSQRACFASCWIKVLNLVIIDAIFRWMCSLHILVDSVSRIGIDMLFPVRALNGAFLIFIWRFIHPLYVCWLYVV